MKLLLTRVSTGALSRRVRGPWNVRWTLVTLLVVALLPALVIGYVLLRSGLNDVAQSSQNEAVRVAVTEQRLAVTALSTHIGSVRATLLAAASFDAVQRLDIEASSNVLNAFTRSNASLTRIDLIAPSGRALASSSFGIARTGTDLVLDERAWIAPHIAAALRGEVTIASVAEGLNNEYALILAVPIRKGVDGSVSGALQSRLSLMEIVKALSRVALATDITIFNNATSAPLVSMTQRASPVAPLASLVALSDTGPNDATLAQSASGQLWVSRMAIPETPLVVAAAALEQPPARIPALLLTVAYFAVGPACIGLLTVYISHRLLGPVATLTQTARAVTAGDHGRRASIESRMLEVNEIGNAFDEMLDELAERRGELTRSREQVRELLQRTFFVQEEEQHRIALDLHDRVAQLLIGALYELQSTQQEPDSGRSAEGQVAKAISTLRLAEEEMRRVIFEIRPPLPSAGGLSSTIQAFLDEQRGRFASCSFLDHGIPPRLTERTAAVAYRVLQEAIRNAAKHAAGSHLEVAMNTWGDWLEIQVTDDGPGINGPSATDSTPPHFGILGMQERAQAVAGSISIGPPQGMLHGTRVTLRLPLAGTELGRGEPTQTLRPEDAPPIRATPSAPERLETRHQPGLSGRPGTGDQGSRPDTTSIADKV